MVGLSAGYLTARSGGWDRDDDWQPLVYGTGIGALAGGVLGLSLGIVDMSRNTPGYGAVILRDTVYGAAFGAAAGGIVGTLALVSTKKGEHVLLGAAVGALAGATAGVALGIVEGNRSLDRSRNPDPQARFSLTLGAAPGLDGDPGLVPDLPRPLLKRRDQGPNRLASRETALGSRSGTRMRAIRSTWRPSRW